MSKLRETSICPEQEPSAKLIGAIVTPGCDFAITNENAKALLPRRNGTAEGMLLREISHRINNELASAISLVSVTANRCNSAEAKVALAAVEDRLRSYAQVHQSLQMPEFSTTIDLAAYLDRLCRAISHSKLESNGIRLSVSLCPVRIRSERCWLLGLVVFELITNAARHAFDGAAGSIRVEVLQGGPSVTCRVTDNGAGEANPGQGTGLRIVEALASRLNGTADLQSGPSGTRAMISFPCSP